MKTVYRFIFSLSVLHIILAIVYLLYGRNSDIYFSDEKFGSRFLAIIVLGSPLAVIGSLFGTLKESSDPRRKIAVICLTLVSAFVLAVSIIAMTLQSEPDENTETWADYRTIYVKKNDHDSEIIEQLSSFKGDFHEPESRYLKVEKLNFIFDRKTVISLESLEYSEWEVAR